MFYNTILFDFDYTLFDTSDGIVKCFNYALNKINKDMVNENLIKQTIGTPLSDAFIQICGRASQYQFNNFKFEYENASKRYMISYSTPNIYVDKLLKFLKLNQIKTGIVTSKDRKAVTDIIKFYDLYKYIDIIVGEEDVKKLKPDKMPLQVAINKLNSKRNDVLYIGDSIIDAESAFNANVDFWCVLTGKTSAYDFYSSNYSVLHSFDSLKDIYEFLKQQKTKGNVL